MSDVKVAVAQALRNDVETREQEMWTVIKALPTTVFINTSEALEAIQGVGNTAWQIQRLREALRILEERK